MKGIASYIHATHIILCNIVLQKIPPSQRDNRWVQSLQETIDAQLYAGGEDSIALKLLKEVSRKDGSVSPHKNNKLDQETLAEELELLFRDSGKVIWIVKKHNDMILAIVKSLLSSPTFQPRSGVLETLWLTIVHWNKIKIPSVRSLLKIEDPDGLDQREQDDNLTEKDRIFRDSIKMQITERMTMKRPNDGSDLKA